MRGDPSPPPGAQGKMPLEPRWHLKRSPQAAVLTRDHEGTATQGAGKQGGGMGHAGAHQHGSAQWEQAVAGGSGTLMDHTRPCRRWVAMLGQCRGPRCPPAHHLAEHPLLQSPQRQFSVFGTVLSHRILHVWHQEVVPRTGGIPQPPPPAHGGTGTVLS